MARKKLRILKSGIKKVLEKVNEAVGEQTSPEKSEKPDYGGLPQIDLKRNLGCG